MATVNPTSVTLNYKKYASQPIGTQIAITIDSGDVLLFKNIPSWLYIDNIVDTSNQSKTVVFNVDIAIANSLNAGMYTTNVEIYSSAYGELLYPVDNDNLTFFGPEPETVYNPVYAQWEYNNTESAEGFSVLEISIPVTLDLENTLMLNASPDNLLFTKNVGDTNPTGKIVQITSEQSWTITKDVGWITLSKTSGNNSDNFTVNVDATGLAVATHTGVITIDEGSASKTINVDFTISEGNTGENYLYVNPTEIEITRNINSTFSETKNIALSSSAAWTATKSENWISLSALSGSSGTDNVVASADITGLSPGVFAGEIVFTHGSFIRKVYLTLTLYDLTVVTPTSNALYFAKDDIKLITSSDKSNSFLQTDCSVKTENNHVLYTKKAPFFLGKATVNIGEEITNILTPLDQPDVLSTEVLALTTPAIINFTAYEVDYFTGQTYDSVYRSNLFFLNGKTPSTTNKLCYLPNEIITTANAVISFSIYKETPPTSIVITGSVSDTISLNFNEDTKVYTLFLDLKDYNLQTKDVIHVDFEGFNFDVKIKEDDVESVLLMFENEWKLPEIIECTGNLNITPTTGYTTQKLQVNKTVHERILETEPGKEFTIISSWIYTQEEKSWLFKILDSKRMWLYINGVKTEVIPTFKKLELYNTNEHQVNYKLTFKKAIV